MGKFSFDGSKGKDAFEQMMEAKANRSGSNFAKENIFFEWGDKDEHIVRIVGEYKWFKNHWINVSNFSPFKLLKDEAFEGDNKLPKNIVCTNWDSETETNDEMGSCPVCKLMKIADNSIKKLGKSMNPEIKQFMKDLRSKCFPTNTFMVKIIDRGNPYVSDGVKGYKILRMPDTLVAAIKKISSDLGIDIVSEDEGIDIKISRNKAGNKTTYSAAPVYKGMSIKQTPLTEEERNYRDLDLSKFGGKKVDETVFASMLVDDVANFWGDEASDDGDAPF